MCSGVSGARAWWAQPRAHARAPGTRVGVEGTLRQGIAGSFFISREKGGGRPKTCFLPPEACPTLGSWLCPVRLPLTTPSSPHQPAQPLMLSCLACACPSRDSRPATAPCMPGPPPPPAHFPWRRRESVAAVYLRAQGTGCKGRGGGRSPLHCENEAHSALGCTATTVQGVRSACWGPQAAGWALGLVTGVLCPESSS